MLGLTIYIVQVADLGISLAAEGVSVIVFRAPALCRRNHLIDMENPLTKSDEKLRAHKIITGGPPAPALYGRSRVCQVDR